LSPSVSAGLKGDAVLVGIPTPETAVSPWEDRPEGMSRFLWSRMEAEEFSRINRETAHRNAFALPLWG
jgi:hypothetical protein